MKENKKICECQTTGTKKEYGNMGFFGWLQLLFIGLKLTGYITWSWFWVLFPMIVVLGITGIILLLGIICWGILKLWR